MTREKSFKRTLDLRKCVGFDHQDWDAKLPGLTADPRFPSQPLSNTENHIGFTEVFDHLNRPATTPDRLVHVRNG